MTIGFLLALPGALIGMAAGLLMQQFPTPALDVPLKLVATDSHITPGHVRVFQAIRSPFYDNITLTSCWVNGEPGVVIVMIDEAGEGKVAVMPLFVAITPGMDIRLPGEGGSSGGGDGGPTDPREDFEAAAAAMCPSPG